MTTLWVDANVVLRFLTAEPADQAEKALALVRLAENGKVLLRLSSVTVAEIVWVLTSFYDQPKPKVAETLAAFFSAPGIRVEDSQNVLAALTVMAAKNVDYADALLAQIARSHGDSVATFDADFDHLGVLQIRPGDHIPS
jgi:predicted nucleic acid-binding protein